jgi:23S rRNA (uracil-5-)-methyltransferase RumA
MSQVVQFEKIVPEGKAMGRLSDGRAVFCIGPLPGETARVALRKQKRTYAEATLREILEPSPQRTGPAEDHAICCSPWQGVDYAYQCELKQTMINDALQQHHVKAPPLEFVGAPQPLGYRNRLDFTLARLDDTLQLAFHQRGSWDSLVPLPHGCKLGSARMNAAALELVAELNRLEIEVEPAVITVRHAHTTDQLLTILTTSAKASWKAINRAKLGHFVVARPMPGSGAPGEVVYADGDSYLTEHLHGVDVAYPYNAFFQTNIPMFEQTLERIIAAVPPNARVVELYSGVGAIGLPLAAAGHQVTGVEIVPEAVEFAERNTRAASLTNYTTHAVVAEKMDAALLQDADCVIVDPPRAGLHPRVAGWIAAAKPNALIYLACNPVTQARDLALLSDHYTVDSFTGFDFYPGALHTESLAICNRK